jgi:hypothetical protein
MTYLLLTLAMALATMLLAPEAPLSRWLKRILVEGPSGWLSRRKRGEMVLWAAFIVFVIICAWAPDIARGIGMLFAGAADSAPILAALIDGSLTLEILLAAWWAASSGALKMLWRLIRRSLDAVPALLTRTFRTLRRQRERRTRRPTTRKPRKPDDSSSDPAWAGLAFA